MDERLLLLAPPRRTVPLAFRNADWVPDEHADRIRQVQRMRGDIYVADGAVQRRDLSGGLHKTPEDEKSWHLLILNADREVTACAWYMEHPNTIAPDKLRASHSPAGMRRASCDTFWKALSLELTRANEAGIGYAELGGWAVAEESRCTVEPLLLTIAAYALARLLGGALGLTTATVRHSSAAILRRLGGSPLEADGVEVARYFDPRYQCEMELLRFDSRDPGTKYLSAIELMTERLSTAVPIIGRPAEIRRPARPAAVALSRAEVVAA